MSAFWQLIRRDLLLAGRQGGAGLLGAAFFVIAVVLFPFAVGPEPETLSRVAAGVIWVAGLLAVLLSLDRLFQADFDDGSLDLLALTPLPLEAVVLAKIVAHWISAIVPLIVIAPALGVFMNLPPSAFPVLFSTMLIGTPTLSLIGAVGAALTVSVRRGGVLLPILVLPFYIPTLIFGVAAVDAATVAGGLIPPLMFLLAITLGAFVLAPIAAAAALRLAIS